MACRTIERHKASRNTPLIIAASISARYHPYVNLVLESEGAFATTCGLSSVKPLSELSVMALTLMATKATTKLATSLLRVSDSSLLEMSVQVACSR